MDEILHGGIPKRNVVLLSGGPGTGKSIFGQQYIYHGLLNGEPGVFVALEEHPVQVRINMSQFGWDVRKYEERGLFAMVDAFTGGIGENNPDIINLFRKDISRIAGSKTKVMVIPTDEEFMIACLSYELVKTARRKTIK